MLGGLRLPFYMRQRDTGCRPRMRPTTPPRIAPNRAPNAVFEPSGAYSGENQGEFNSLPKFGKQAALGAISKIGKTLSTAASQETRTFRAGNVVTWQGSSPVEFSIDVLFCKPDYGVYYGALYPLVEASSFSSIAFGNYLYGPRGYNSPGFGIGAIERILNGEFKSLHSLKLWYDASDEFNSGQAKSTHVIMDLFRLLVITNLQITVGEQLLFDPSKPKSAPLYKWIKATIGFKTACPVPGSLFVTPGSVARGKSSNASLHDFYGHRDAIAMDNYADPITDKGLDSTQVPNYGDMLRLVPRKKQ
jgi:hypothetical protein